MGMESPRGKRLEMEMLREETGEAKRGRLRGEKLGMESHERLRTEEGTEEAKRGVAGKEEMEKNYILYL